MRRQKKLISSRKNRKEEKDHHTTQVKMSFLKSMWKNGKHKSKCNYLVKKRETKQIADKLMLIWLSIQHSVLSRNLSDVNTPKHQQFDLFLDTREQKQKTRHWLSSVLCSVLCCCAYIFCRRKYKSLKNVKKNAPTCGT